MVPVSFHDFFVASAGVAGALIGLLFVAVSISGELTGPGADRRLQVRASAAFSALINPLVLSLTALIPETELTLAPLLLGALGISTTLAMMVALFGLRRSGVNGRDYGLQFALLVAYAAQVSSALTLRSDPSDVGQIKTQAALTIAFLLIGIFRAWELLGARNRRLTGIVAALRDHEE